MEDVSHICMYVGRIHVRRHKGNICQTKVI